VGKNGSLFSIILLEITPALAPFERKVKFCIRLLAFETVSLSDYKLCRFRAFAIFINDCGRLNKRNQPKNLLTPS
jgi:hypothetical protein